MGEVIDFFSDFVFVYFYSLWLASNFDEHSNLWFG